MNRASKILFGRKARLAIIVVGSLILFLLVWLVFFQGSGSSYEGTAEERRLETLLESFEHVDDVSVMVSLTDGKPTSAVVIFRGKDSLLLRKNILSACASALNIPQKSVQVYPASA